jgi:hypothetical protein
MIGARHWAGSTIWNGGDSSPSNWVIVGRRPCHPLAASFQPQERSLYACVFSVIATILPSEKTLYPAGTYLNDRKGPPSLR